MTIRSLLRSGSRTYFRRLAFEACEERRLLAALAKFDFNGSSGESGPAGWTKLLFSNAAAGAVDPSGIGVKITTAVQGFGNAYSSSTIPSDATVIRGGFLKTGILTDEATIGLVLLNLAPEKSYEVWVLGGNNTGALLTQRVSVEGAGGTTAFNQSLGNLNLWVNASAGNSAIPVTAFTPVLVPTPLHDDLNGDGTLDSHVVRISLTKLLGFTAAQIAGVVIREYTPVSEFVLPAGGSPFTLKIENDKRILKDAANNPVAIFAGSGPITIQGADAASETLIVDLAGGNPVGGGVTFHAGAGGSDELRIVGGNQGTVTYDYASAHDGSVFMSNFGTVTYTGLDPLVNTGTAGDVVFNLPPSANFVSLSDDGISGNGLSRLSAASIETTDFANPTGSLTINRGGAADVVTVNSLPDFNAAVTIGSRESPFSGVAMAGAVSLAAGKSLSASALAVVSTATGAVSVSGGGAISLLADTAAIDGSSVISAGGGTFAIAPVTSGQPIDLGGSDVAGVLALSDAELDRVWAAALQIGGTGSGSITVSADITRSAPTVVNLISGGAIQLTGGLIDTAGGHSTLAPGAAGNVAAEKSGIDAALGASGTFRFAAGSTLSLAINGTAVDAQYQQLNVAGQIDLTGASLVVGGTHAPAATDMFVLVENDGDDAVTGEFNGLPEASTLSINGTSMRITYAGGSGNDVALLPVVIAPPPPQVVEGTAGDDTFDVRRDPADAARFLLSVNGGPDFIFLHPASIVLSGLAGNDTLNFSDTGYTSGATATITEVRLEWLTSLGGSADIRFDDIEALVVTGTAAGDVLDVMLNPGSNLKTAAVSGQGGDDLFFLDLNTANHIANDVAGLQSVSLRGDDGNDTFGNSVLKIEPSTTASIVINGGSPIVGGMAPFFNATAGNTVGDTIHLDLTPSYASPSATASVTTVGGSVQTTGYKSLNFSHVEAIQLSDGGRPTSVQMGDLFIRGTNSADIIQFGASSAPNIASTRINNSIISLGVTTKTIVYGRGGNDSIMQGSLNRPAEFYGEAGDDYLTGYHASDLLVGGEGHDRLNGGEGANELWGDSWNDDLPAGGNDILSAGGGNDRFYGGGGNDSITAGRGDDYAYGGYGDDTIDGGDGHDRLYGGEGNDTLAGAGGNDLVAGNQGDDKLYGKAGHDVLLGGVGADYLSGEDGNDLLLGGSIIAGAAMSDASVRAGDPIDLGLADLLADWAADNFLSFSIASDDDAIDTLSGGLGTDTARSDPLDTGDWELALL